MNFREIKIIIPFILNLIITKYIFLQQLVVWKSRVQDYSLDPYYGTMKSLYSGAMVVANSQNYINYHLIFNINISTLTLVIMAKWLDVYARDRSPATFSAGRINKALLTEIEQRKTLSKTLATWQTWAETVFYSNFGTQLEHGYKKCEVIRRTVKQRMWSTNSYPNNHDLEKNARACHFCGELMCNMVMCILLI